MSGISLPADATKTNMDTGTDDPKLARAELADLVDKFNSLKDEVGSDRLQWPIALPGVAYSSATSFTTTDATACHAGRMVQIVGSSTGTVYGRITDVSGSTVTVSGVTLSNETLTAWLGVASLKHTSIPFSRITPQMLGEVGTADDTSVFQAFAAMPGAKHIPSGTYILSEQVTFDQDTDLTIGAHVVLDFSAAATAADFPDDACLYFDGGDLTALPALSGDVVEGANSFTLASAPTLSEGDVIMIYDPTDSSFSTQRTYLRAGEFLRVLSVSGSTVKVYGSLFAGYAAATVDLYKLAGRRVCITGGQLHVIAPDSLNTVRCIELWRCVDSRADGLGGSNSGNAAVKLGQCYNIEGSNLSPRQLEDAGFSTDYGLVISNCQKVRVSGDFYARRHAVTTGGGDEVGVVPNREIHCSGTFTNDPESTIACANVHANIEYYTFEGVFNGFINPGGDFGRWKGQIIVKHSSSNGKAIEFQNLHGWSHDLSGLQIYALGDPNATARGTIDIGGNSSEADADTVRGGVLNLSGMKIRAPDSNRALEIRNRGSAPSEDIVIDLRGTEFVELAAGITTGARIDVISGNNYARVELADFHMAGGPAYSTSGIDKITGWRASGTLTFTPDTASTFDDIAVVFPRKAPKAPQVSVNYTDGSFIGTVFPVAAAKDVTKTGFTARLATPDQSTFAASTSRSASYIAAIDE